MSLGVKHPGVHPIVIDLPYIILRFWGRISSDTLLAY